MNIRKNIDYSEMYATLDQLMAQQLPQMELYCAIGKAVCQRTEKGSAVMASEYLNMRYPDAKGFSPRSLRRMRDFYRTYENHPSLLSRAMQLGWIQNVVIMEADLTMELREWYMKAAKQFGWSKSELLESIATNVHEVICITCGEELQSMEDKHEITKRLQDIFIRHPKQFLQITILNTYRWILIKGGRRRWNVIRLISQVATFCEFQAYFYALRDDMMQKHNRSVDFLYMKVFAFANKPSK